MFEWLHLMLSLLSLIILLHKSLHILPPSCGWSSCNLREMTSFLLFAFMDPFQWVSFQTKLSLFAVSWSLSLFGSFSLSHTFSVYCWRQIWYVSVWDLKAFSYIQSHQIHWVKNDMTATEICYSWRRTDRSFPVSVSRFSPWPRPFRRLEAIFSPLSLFFQNILSFST